jgi:hypothetical protein
MYIGDLALYNGYVSGTKVSMRRHEIIWFDAPVADASWTATAYSTSTNIVPLNANFGNVVPRGSRGVILRVRCRDSGSAAAASDATSVSLGTRKDVNVSGGTFVGTVSCTGLPNDSWATGVIWVALDPMENARDIKIYCFASGAGTLDVTVELIGVIS